MGGKYNPLAMTHYDPVFVPSPPIDLNLQRVEQSPAVCVEINEDFIPYILGVLESYRWSDKFTGNDE